MHTILEALDACLAEARARASRPSSGAAWLAWIIACAAGLAAVVAALGGYHAGFAALNDSGRTLPAPFLQCLTFSGDTLFALAFTLIFAARRPELVRTGVIAGVIAALAAEGLKHGLGIARPPVVLDAGHIRIVGQALYAGSFPSGHTTAAFVVAGLAVRYFESIPARVVALAIAGLVGLSRVWVGAHWPVDVLAGAALGAGAVLAAAPVAARWSGGLRRAGHFAIVASLAGCAIALLIRGAPDTAASLYARVVAGAVLAWTLWAYLNPGGKSRC